jgi:hypothetical protein
LAEGSVEKAKALFIARNWRLARGTPGIYPPDDRAIIADATRDGNVGKWIYESGDTTVFVVEAVVEVEGPNDIARVVDAICIGACRSDGTK